MSTEQKMSVNSTWEEPGMIFVKTFTRADFSKKMKFFRRHFRLILFIELNVIPTRRCTTVRDSEGQAIPCNGGSDGSVRVMGKWSMQWGSG